MAQLAADETGLPVKADLISRSQTIPLKFLLGILNELKRARLVRRKFLFRTTVEINSKVGNAQCL